MSNQAVKTHMDFAVKPPAGEPRTPPSSDSNDEVEIKFLVPENPVGHVNDSIFPKMESFFKNNGLERSAQTKALISRQLDVPDRRLEKCGVTLRSRGECDGTDLHTIKHPDLCLKLGANIDPDSAALCRREFETAAGNFKRPGINALRKAFPRRDTPEVHDALAGIQGEDLREFFQIQCKRQRILIEIPERLTGIKGKRVIGELQLDESLFVVPIKGPQEYVIIGRDLEVEMELMKKPCPYDRSPEAKNLVCSKLTPDEEITAMIVARELIQQAAGGVLRHNGISKADRGFDYLDKSRLHEHLALYTPRTPEQRRIQPALACDGDTDVYKLLKQNLRELMDRVQIATFQPT